MLIGNGQEYTLFCNWVSSLPETPRATSAGQSLISITSDHMYMHSEGKGNECDDSDKDNFGLQDWDEDLGEWVVVPAQVA
jgi:hypothetical protein